MLRHRWRAFRRRHPIPGLPKDKWGSRYGQDLWVLQTLRKKRGGYFVELGALDGVRNSNTIFLEQRYGWTGICIEAHAEAYRELVENRSCIRVQACVDDRSHRVTFHARRESRGESGIVAEGTDNRHARFNLVQMETVTLTQILRDHEAPPVMDYLSLDTEGSELRIMRSFDHGSYRFRCMTIERCPEPLHRLLSDHGYLLVKLIRKRKGQIIDYGYAHRNDASPKQESLEYTDWRT